MDTTGLLVLVHKARLWIEAEMEEHQRVLSSSLMIALIVSLYWFFVRISDTDDEVDFQVLSPDKRQKKTMKDQSKNKVPPKRPNSGKIEKPKSFMAKGKTDAAQKTKEQETIDKSNKKTNQTETKQVEKEQKKDNDKTLAEQSKKTKGASKANSGSNEKWTVAGKGKKPAKPKENPTAKSQEKTTTIATTQTSKTTTQAKTHTLKKSLTTPIEVMNASRIRKEGETSASRPVTALQFADIKGMLAATAAANTTNKWVLIPSTMGKSNDEVRKSLTWVPALAISSTVPATTIKPLTPGVISPLTRPSSIASPTSAPLPVAKSPIESPTPQLSKDKEATDQHSDSRSGTGVALNNESEWPTPPPRRNSIEYMLFPEGPTRMPAIGNLLIEDATSGLREKKTTYSFIVERKTPVKKGGEEKQTKPPTIWNDEVKTENRGSFNLEDNQDDDARIAKAEDDADKQPKITINKAIKAPIAKYADGAKKTEKAETKDADQETNASVKDTSKKSSKDNADVNAQTTTNAGKPKKARKKGKKSNNKSKTEMVNLTKETTTPPNEQPVCPEVKAEEPWIEVTKKDKGKKKNESAKEVNDKKMIPSLLQKPMVEREIHEGKQETEMAIKMQAQNEEIKALKIQSEKQIHAITQNYEQRLDKLREAIVHLQKNEQSYESQDEETTESTDDDKSEGAVGSIVEQIDEILEDIREKNEMLIEKVTEAIEDSDSQSEDFDMVDDANEISSEAEDEGKAEAVEHVNAIEAEDAPAETTPSEDGDDEDASFPSENYDGESWAARCDSDAEFQQLMNSIRQEMQQDRENEGDATPGTALFKGSSVNWTSSPISDGAGVQDFVNTQHEEVKEWKGNGGWTLGGEAIVVGGECAVKTKVEKTEVVTGNAEKQEEWQEKEIGVEKKTVQMELGEKIIAEKDGETAPENQEERKEEKGEEDPAKSTVADEVVCVENRDQPLEPEIAKAPNDAQTGPTPHEKEINDVAPEESQLQANAEDSEKSKYPESDAVAADAREEKESDTQQEDDKSEDAREKDNDNSSSGDNSSSPAPSDGEDGDNGYDNEGDDDEEEGEDEEGDDANSSSSSLDSDDENYIPRNPNH